jgi:cell wall-associated NlpC family hydrolase
VKHVDRYLGLRFARGGRGPTVVDCWGLVKLYLEQQHGLTGLPLYQDADPKTAIAEAMAATHWMKTEIPRAGDVVVMLTPIGGTRVAPLHVGVMVSDNHVMHIDEGYVSVFASLQHPTIKLRLHGFWRHKDML